MDFRAKLLAGEPLYGTVVTLATSQASEALAQAGCDWLWIDMEHGPLDLASVQGLLLGAGASCASLVRVPSNDPVWLKRVLDLGPEGVIVPHVSSADDARAAVDACWYPPRGSRSVGIGRAQGYGSDLVNYLDRSHAELLVVPQIEDGAAVDAVDSILAVDGIECVIVGPFDLSASLGHPGELDHPSVVAAIRRVRDACARADKRVGIFAGTNEFAKAWQAEGISWVALSVDVSLLAGAARSSLSELRGERG